MSIGCSPIIATITGSGSYIIPDGFEAYVLLAESSLDLVINGATIIKGSGGGESYNCAHYCNTFGGCETILTPSAPFNGILSGTINLFSNNYWRTSVKLYLNETVLASSGTGFGSGWTANNVNKVITTGDVLKIKSVGTIWVHPDYFYTQANGTLLLSGTSSKPALGNVYLTEGDIIFGGIYTLNLYQKGS